ncbi:MAG: CxxxxCH/CxxCH domain c-type cytochrome [Myxococcales bacterium]
MSTLGFRVRQIALRPAIGLLLGLAACRPTPLGDGLPDEVRCVACHGSEASPAPPVAVDGAVGTWETGVGAHQVHLSDGLVRKAISCSECHKVPRSSAISEHIGGRPAELTWGELATARGSQPRWERESATCSSTYCHGAQLTGGERTSPKWTFTEEPAWRGSLQPETCRGCHGAPPPAPHPESSNCASCHRNTVRADGSIDLAGGRHINGTVDVAGQAGCTVCHGSSAGPAPDVGAHLAHLKGGDVRAAVACDECHLVPQSVEQSGHRDGDGEVELKWGPLASAAGTSPAFESGSCSGVYCHGATLPGGSLKAPEWSKTDGTQDACGTCHGAPPPAPHPPGGACVSCHPSTVKPDGAIDLAGGRHIDGEVDVGTRCSSCHGGQGNAAPPFDTHRNESTSVPGVGAHQSHVRDGALRKAVGCSECHPAPSSRDATGHLDGDGRAELVFGELARKSGANPSYDGTSCSSTYCHGAMLSGGTLRDPEWTKVDGTRATCGTCHGAPPPAPHLQNESCATCHSGTVNADGTINVDGGLHMRTVD